MGHKCGKVDSKALYKIGYGLYLVTSRDGEKENGMIVNTVIQVKSSPSTLAVTINKGAYSHELIKKTGKMVVHCLDKTTPFEFFENFGFHSGRDYDKFKKYGAILCENGLPLVTERFINAVFQLKCVNYLDLDTHGMFICEVEGAAIFNPEESITYDYYQNNVKPKPAEVKQEEKKQGYVCKICGYIHEGDTLPADFVCPICRHGAEAFEKIK